MIHRPPAFVLMLLEPPSPASSTGPREVERSLQPTPQLPETLPMTSPPEPEQHRDAAESSRVTPLFKRLQTRFRNTNKSKTSQPPDQLSTQSGQPVNPRSDSQSPPTAHIANTGPSTMAAGRRQRVGVFFFGRQYGMSDEASQRTVSRSVNWVREPVCSLALLFTLRDSERKIPRLLKRAIRSRTRLVVDKRPQVQRKRAPCVSFQVIVVHIVNPHVLLGATGERTISVLGSASDGGSRHGAHSLFRLVVMLTVEYIRKKRAKQTSRSRSSSISRCPHGCCVCVRALRMGGIDPSISSSYHVAAFA